MQLLTSSKVRRPESGAATLSLTQRVCVVQTPTLVETQRRGRWLFFKFFWGHLMVISIVTTVLIKRLEELVGNPPPVSVNERALSVDREGRK